MYNQQQGPPPAGFAMPQPGYANPGYPPGPGHGPPPVYPGSGGGGNFYGAAEEGRGGDQPGDNMGAFSDKAVRMGFIRKVYSILSVQLIITFGFVLIFATNTEAKLWASKSTGWLILAFVFSIGSLIALTCCGSVRRKFPMNFICLGIFTLAQSFVLGVTTAFYKTDVVLLAIGMTAAVVIGITIFACQTKIDFTVYSGVAFVFLIILMVMGVVLMFFKLKILHVIYSSLGALLFSFYLIIDTQMIMGGNRKETMSPEEYIYGAITLYTDIINIFIYILQLLNAASD